MRDVFGGRENGGGEGEVMRDKVKVVNFEWGSVFEDW